jgi:hypothetical protein
MLEEDLLGSVDNRQLQLFLGSEMSKNSSLAHLQLGREPPDREPLKPFGGGDIGADAEDLAPSSGRLVRAIENCWLLHSTIRI